MCIRDRQRPVSHEGGRGDQQPRAAAREPGAARRGLRQRARSDRPGNWRQRGWATAQLASPGDGRA
eukprot:1650286-Alexandrium_andersonii.AAC.1